MNLKWYGGKNDPQQKAILDQQNNKDEDCMILVKDHPYRDKKTGKTLFTKQYCAMPINNLENFIENTPIKYRNFYEVIQNNCGKYRMTFDIDGGVGKRFTQQEVDELIKNKQVYVNKIIKLIKEAIKQFGTNLMTTKDKCDFYIYTSSDKTKFSYHIMIVNYYITNWVEDGKLIINTMKQIIDKNKEEYSCIEKLLDSSIYSNNRSLRLFKCCKPGRPTKIGLPNKHSDNYLDNLVFIYDDKPNYKILIKNRPQKEEIPKIETKKYENLQINKKEEYEDIKKIIEFIDWKKRDNYQSYVNSAYALYDCGDEYFELFNNLWESLGYSEENHKKERINLWESATKSLEKPITKNTLYFWLKEDNEEKFNEITKKKDIAYCTPNYHVLDKLRNHTYENKYVQPIDYNNIKEKAILLKSALGTGKSTILYSLLEDKNLSCLVLSPRQKFARSFAKRFNIDCYLDNNKDDNLFENSNRIVVSIESLWKLDKKQFDLVFLDESESCLSQFISFDTIKENLKPCISNFEFFLKNAKRIIACDAFLMMRTIQLFQDLEIPYYFIENTYKHKREAKQIEVERWGKEDKRKNRDFFIQEVFKEMSEGKKIFVVSTSKLVLDALEFYISNKLPNSNIKIRKYTGSDSDYKEDFEDVNKTWVNYDLVMTTTTITVGVNFDLEYFDHVYMYASGMAGPIRDIFQSHMRVRHFKKLKFYLTTKICMRGPILGVNKAIIQEKLNDWNDYFKKTYNTEINRTKWFENNYIFSTIEKNMQLNSYDLIDIFYKYYHFCGYKSEENDDFENIGFWIQDNDPHLLKNDIYWDYEDIENISKEDAQECYKKILSAEATEFDKIELLKYRYKNKFNEVLDKDVQKIIAQRFSSPTKIDGYKETLEIIEHYKEIKNHSNKNKYDLNEELSANQKIMKSEVISTFFNKLEINDPFEEYNIPREKIQELINDNENTQKLFRLYGVRDRNKSDQLTEKSFGQLFAQMLNDYLPGTKFGRGKRQQGKINGKRIDISPFLYKPIEDFKILRKYIK